jgi:hypothetical protein
MNAPSLVLWHLKSPRVWSPRGIRDESCQPIDVVRPDTVVSLRFLYAMRIDNVAHAAGSRTK